MCRNIRPADYQVELPDVDPVNVCEDCFCSLAGLANTAADYDSEYPPSDKFAENQCNAPTKEFCELCSMRDGGAGKLMEQLKPVILYCYGSNQ